MEKFAYRFLLHLNLNVSPTEKHEHHHHPPPLCPQHLLLLFQLNIFVHLRVVVFFVCAALCCSSNRTSPLSTPTYLLHEMLIYSLLSAASACVYNPPTNQPTNQPTCCASSPACLPAYLCQISGGSCIIHKVTFAPSYSTYSSVQVGGASSCYKRESEVESAVGEKERGTEGTHWKVYN